MFTPTQSVYQECVPHCTVVIIVIIIIIIFKKVVSLTTSAGETFFIQNGRSFHLSRKETDV